MNYKKGVPRVSNIVSFVYPFGGQDKDRYLKWLDENNIKEDEYLGGANELGTYIHKQMENFINGEEIDKTSPFYNEVKKIIDNGIEYLKKYSKYKLLTEVYIIDGENRFQGTTDLVMLNEKTNEIIVCDFKSFGVVKRRYGFDNKSTLDKHKKEKVRLQLSLYAQAMLYHNKDYSCSKVKLLYLHDDLVREYEMDIIPKEEIDNILLKYYTYTNKKKEKDFNININDMKIELRIPTAQYAYINLDLDLSKTDNGKTSNENIDDMFKVAKYMKQKYFTELQ